MKSNRKYSTDPLQRNIEMREAAIKRAEKRKTEIRRAAEDECDAIDRMIATKRVLIDALKKGTPRV